MTITNISQLKTTAPSGSDTATVLGYYTPGDGGGGTFYWDALSTESDDTGTIFETTASATGRWKRLYSTPLNVQWFGAKGNGIADDTAAIQAAIGFGGILGYKGTVNNTTYRVAGFSVFFPATKNGYRITNTLKVPPYCSLLGEAGGGYFFGGSNKVAQSTLVADFSANLAWVIDTDNFDKTGSPIAPNAITTATLFDKGEVSGNYGVEINKLNIIVKSNKRLFGGIRLAVAQYSRISDCYVYGTDIGYLCCGCAGDTKINSRSETYKAGVLALYENNNVSVNGYYDRIAGTTTPLPETQTFFNSLNIFFAGTDLPDYTNSTFGYIGLYNYGSVSQSLIVQHWDIGAAICNSEYTCECLYAEGCGESIVSYTCDAVFNEVVGSNNGATLRAGANTKMYFNGVRQDSTPAFFNNISRWYTEISVPGTVAAYANHRNLVHRVPKHTVYLSSTGSDSQHGYTEAYPVKTLEAALLRATVAQYNFSDSVQPPAANVAPVMIYILDNTTYDLNTDVSLYNAKLLVTSAVKPTINFATGVLRMSDSSIHFNNIKINKTPDTKGNGEDGFLWSTTGQNKATFSSCELNISPGRSAVYLNYSGASMMDLSLYNTQVKGDATTRIVQGNYLNNSPHYLTYLIGYLCSLANGIETRGDKGIQVPASWIIKSNA
ncbi:glycosyl hydrolase family 28-related protein [Taibaiella helva]|uniref:glycosyl hydrolase family 28-related protein n=1 Tax=Taibaiella helva TaxID=2301235 RepID=UPI000E592362|nr:glycosyl hydrolase family 28-related protein [Taibaiella helva]